MVVRAILAQLQISGLPTMHLDRIVWATEQDEVRLYLCGADSWDGKVTAQWVDRFDDTSMLFRSTQDVDPDSPPPTWTVVDGDLPD